MSDESNQNQSAQERLLIAICAVSTLANDLDLPQNILQNAIFVARGVDAQKKGVTQERFAASAGYSDAKSVRDRSSRIKGEIGIERATNEKMLEELLIEISRSMGFVERIQNAFDSGQLVSKGEILDVVKLKGDKLISAIFRDAESRHVIAKQAQSDLYEVRHEKEVQKLFRNIDDPVISVSKIIPTRVKRGNSGAI